MTAAFRAKRRVAFVNSHPIQYFAPLYAHINRSPDIEAVPIYLSDSSLRGGFDRGFGRAVTWDIDLLAGTKPIFVKNADRNDATQMLKLIAPDVWGIVRNGDFDAVVVHGFVFGANLVAMAAAKSKGIPVLARGETHNGLPSQQGKSLRTRASRLLYRHCDGVLAIGSANRAFYRSVGLPDGRIFDFPYTVDNARMSAAGQLSADERWTIRAGLGVEDDRPIVLYASKFMRRKHPDDLLQACARLARDGLPLALVMGGAGEMEEELRAMAMQNPALQVAFPGFLNQSELPRLFGASDVFVLPSEDEPWGLIINEAMCAGLPIVASREIGAVADLLHDGENGHVFDARDVDGLTAALRPIVVDPGLRAAMGRRSAEIIAGWSYDRAEAGLRAALDHVKAGGRTPA